MDDGDYLKKKDVLCFPLQGDSWQQQQQEEKVAAAVH